MPPSNLKFQESCSLEIFNFKVANLNLHTDLFFPELSPITTDFQSIALSKTSLLQLRKPLEPAKELKTKQTKTHLDNSLFCQILENSFYYCFRFEDNISFYISKNNSKECFYAADNNSHDLLKHLYLDYVLPHILSLELSLVLHSSVLSFKGSGVILIGNSGTGKSTLSASLLSRNWKLVSDDYSLINQDNYIIPSYPSIRLWPDSYKLFNKEELGVTKEFQVTNQSLKLKLKLKDEKFNSEKVPLKSIFILENNHNIKENYEIKKKKHKDSIFKIISSSYSLDLKSSSKQFQKAGELLKKVPIYSLAYRHDKESTEIVCKTINGLIS